MNNNKIIYNFIRHKCPYVSQTSKASNQYVHSKGIIESFPPKVHMTKLTNKNEIVKNKTFGSIQLISPKLYNKSV